MHENARKYGISITLELHVLENAVQYHFSPRFSNPTLSEFPNGNCHTRYTILIIQPIPFGKHTRGVS